MQKKKGISLIVLVITIIVMLILILILAAATMITLIGDNGIITKAQEAAFREEMLSIRETVDLYNIITQVKGDTEIALVPITETDIDNGNFKASLKIEMPFGETMI